MPDWLPRFVNNDMGKNYRKETWLGRLTNWYSRPAGNDEVWFHIRLDREPDRPVSVKMSGAEARQMMVDLVIEDGPLHPGLFTGELSRIDQIAHLRLLRRLGVPEDVAREVSGVRKETE